MGGWIKLWRKPMDNRYLTMPNVAFKIWIYCMLHAAPYPNPFQELEAGDLWLSYKELQQALSVRDGPQGADQGGVLSRSTIAIALQYLKDNGYLATEKGKYNRIKVKVINWQSHQAGQDPAGTVDMDFSEYQNDTHPVRKSNSPSSKIELTQFENRTHLVRKSNSPSSKIELSTGLKPNDTNDSEASKNKRIIENIRKVCIGSKPPAEKTKYLDQILNHHSRYTEEQRALIKEYWQIITDTQPGRQLTVANIDWEMKQWEKYEAGLIAEALTLHLEGYQEKQVAYTRGIIQRLQGEQTGKKRKGVNQHGNPNQPKGADSPDSMRRIVQSFLERNRSDWLDGDVSDL